ncbi:uncharacterized protein SPSK_02873 [Sporothrix schenckii 1099-18]|uniref:Uncharacterized protein n=2 Tax=Sporothrix schenckii TaxID=29908 RepID=U7PQ77_SPOS1|nr:uncharacterized protein SPSK_02873 [Sporothrix schenckii 1099-18]ERS97086.1 hypothetical protein HMPREF1624_06415 [Sporothrix schenckii ATCC 58251]KJR86292.1 hypothetical protein SPSK_02873 [Sporothrix schenckii 1099-18]
MNSASDANAQELLDQFLTENPPKQLTDALTKFLSSPLPTLHHPVSWMPPADEVAVRLDLVRQLQKNFIKSICGLERDFMFTAS